MKVLLVDDDGDSREIYSAYLIASGCEVLAAEDGREGIRIAEIWAPDVIVMDLRIPEMDGWEATRRLKALEATRGIPVLVVSADIQPASRARAEAAGCAGYLTKPVEPRAVLDAVQQAARAA